MIRINRPDWFTKEKYLEYKSNGVSDKDIYEEILFISLPTFNRFKRELGVLGVGNRGGHNKKIDYKKAKMLHDKGYSPRTIANRFNCKLNSIYRAIK